MNTPLPPDPDFFTDKNRVRRSFDRAAHSYDDAAVLQREINHRMLERLDYIKLQPNRVLDAGAGTGYGTQALRQRYPTAQLLALDIALGMLQTVVERRSLVERGLNWLRRRQDWAVCADLEALPLASGSVDLIWSNLALQWLNQPDRAFAEMHRALRVDGVLMFSTFGPDTLKELRAAFAGVDGYNHVNRFIDMHDLGDALVEAGFAEPVMDMEVITLTYTDIKAVMRDLKAIGAHNATQGRARGLMGKTAWSRVCAAYEQFRRDDRLPATYEVVYGHAWKVAPKHVADGRQIIEFRPRPHKR